MTEKELSELMDTMKNTVIGLVHTQRQANAKVAETEKMLTSYKEKCDSLTTLLSKYKSDYERVKQDQVCERQALEQVKLELSQKNSKIAELEKRLEKYEKTQSQLQSHISDASVHRHVITSEQRTKGLQQVKKNATRNREELVHVIERYLYQKYGSTDKDLRVDMSQIVAACSTNENTVRDMIRQVKEKRIEVPRQHGYLMFWAWIDQGAKCYNYPNRH